MVDLQKMKSIRQLVKHKMKTVKELSKKDLDTEIKKLKQVMDSDWKKTMDQHVVNILSHYSEADIHKELDKMKLTVSWRADMVPYYQALKEHARKGVVSTSKSASKLVKEVSKSAVRMTAKKAIKKGTKKILKLAAKKGNIQIKRKRPVRILLIDSKKNNKIIKNKVKSKKAMKKNKNKTP